MTKMLITGITGFVGKNAALYFAKKNYEIYGYYRETDLNGSHPEIILHCAAERTKESEMFESNTMLTAKLLERFKNKNITFIYVGTSSEYGTWDYPISETYPLKPENTYAITKASGSLLCIAYRPFYKNIIIIRPFSLYGPYDRSNHFIPTLYDCYKNKKKMKLISDVPHDWIYIDDLLRGIEMILYSNNSDIVNLGSGIQHTNLEVYDLFCSLIKDSIEVELSQQNKTKKWVCDISYAAKTYSFKCKYSLIEGLKKYIEFREENSHIN